MSSQMNLTSLKTPEGKINVLNCKEKPRCRICDEVIPFGKWGYFCPNDKKITGIKYIETEKLLGKVIERKYFHVGCKSSDNNYDHMKKYTNEEKIDHIHLKVMVSELIREKNKDE